MEVRHATPAMIQQLGLHGLELGKFLGSCPGGGCRMGILRYMTKLVECPVVDRMPRRSLVL